MYDLSGLATATDAFWQAIAQRLQAAGVTDIPPTLTRDMPVELLWRDPRLLLAQSCGYPLMTSLFGRIRLVATPCYRAAGCTGSRHGSAIIVRADDDRQDLAALRGSRCVANHPHSNTGMNLLRAAVAALAGGRPFFRSVTWSGSHRSSLAMIAKGEADLAAIDAVTFALLRRIEPDLVAQTRILGWTEATPCLPFITAGDTDDATVEILRAALLDISAAPTHARLRDELLLDGFAIMPEVAYQDVLALERRAADLGYPDLR
jgi:ABC-type phosphate/phosphonate transport system substrate-binding protein